MESSKLGQSGWKRSEKFQIGEEEVKLAVFLDDKVWYTGKLETFYWHETQENNF